LVWAIDRKIQRVPGREIFHELLKLAKEKKYRVFLLGGKPGAAEKIAALCQMSNANCQVFVDDGPRENEAEILEKIRQTRPSLLFVAYGAPYQEEWILNHREALIDAGVKIAMVVGGAFEYEAGMVPKVPQVIQDLHLEWLHRLISQPWRWRRQLKGLSFFWLVLRNKF
jgi:N-acetylglucosaminyldiphosphoundecaprenol N-acetyl-beta-D-mannosaminyltransferase